jgi:hypothetical protein
MGPKPKGWQNKTNSPSGRAIVSGGYLLTSAYYEQTYTIGWDAFLRGRVSKLWGEAYREECSNVGPMEVLQWLSELI